MRKDQVADDGNRSGRFVCKWCLWIECQHKNIEYCVFCGARRVIVENVRKKQNAKKID